MQAITANDLAEWQDDDLRLQLAASEMSEALKGILEWWEVKPCRPAGDKPTAISEARAVIAKAKGGAA